MGGEKMGDHRRVGSFAMCGGKFGGSYFQTNPNGYGSIPIDTIFSGMNIHLPAILGFTRYQGFDPSPNYFNFAVDWIPTQLVEFGSEWIE